MIHENQYDANEDSNEAARNLHDQIAYVFENYFRTLGYRASFSFTPSRHASIYAKPGRDTQTVARYFRQATGTSVKPGMPIHTQIAYSPVTEKLDITSLTLPVVSTRIIDAITLKQFSANGFSGHPGSIYLALRNDELIEHIDVVQPADGSESLETIDATFALDETIIKQLLYEAGYSHPEIFTTPHDLRQHMRETFSNAEEWDRQEIVHVPVSPTTEWILARTSGILRDTKRDDAHDDLIAEHRMIDDTGVVRVTQVVFVGENYTVNGPTVKVWSEIPERNADAISKRGPNAMSMVDHQEYRLTRAEEIDIISEQLIEDLGDIA